MTVAILARLTCEHQRKRYNGDLNSTHGEGIPTAASYREPFKARRCIVPASGYFEWTGPKNDRQPHHFTRAGGQPMGLAGLWDRWRNKDKSETKETFIIVTPSPACSPLSSMPLVLELDTWDLWMEGDPEAAAALMKPANENVLFSRPVSKAVGNVKNNGPELLDCWTRFLLNSSRSIGFMAGTPAAGMSRRPPRRQRRGPPVMLAASK